MIHSYSNHNHGHHGFKIETLWRISKYDHDPISIMVQQAASTWLQSWEAEQVPNSILCTTPQKCFTSTTLSNNYTPWTPYILILSLHYSSVGYQSYPKCQPEQVAMPHHQQCLQIGCDRLMISNNYSSWCTHYYSLSTVIARDYSWHFLTMIDRYSFCSPLQALQLAIHN